MSEKRGIRYLESPNYDGDVFGGISVVFDEKRGDSKTRDDDFSGRRTFKSFRAAEIDGDVYLLVMESVVHEATDPHELSTNFDEIDEGFEEKIEIPSGAFGCTAQRNRIVNAMKINKDGLLEKPSDELMEDLLSRKGSYTFECGVYPDDFEQDESQDIYLGESDIDDKLFEEELIPPTALGIDVDESVDGVVLTVEGYPITIRNNGTVQDELGNRFENGELAMVDSELAKAALETRRIENKFADVIHEANRVRRDDRRKDNRGEIGE